MIANIHKITKPNRWRCLTITKSGQLAKYACVNMMRGWAGVVNKKWPTSVHRNACEPISKDNKNKTMAEFKPANQLVLANEGGWNHVSGDDETYCGLNRRFNPNWEGWAIVDSHKPLHYNEVIKDDSLNSLVSQYYKRIYWDRILADGIDSQAVATYFYDFYVNAGSNAVKCVQKVVGANPDGFFGTSSLHAVNDYVGDLLADLHKSRCEYYNRIGTNGSAKFLTGWLNRANKMYEILSA